MDQFKYGSMLSTGLQVESLHESLFDICHLPRFRSNISSTYFFVDPHMQMISNWYEILHDTQT